MNADRFIRTLLRLLPIDFRAEYGGEMRRVFHEQRLDAGGAGRAGEGPVWWLTLRDVVAAASREHVIAFGHDVRHAVRGLIAQPAFAAAAVLTLALGIGANTAIFSVVHAVLLRPLPYADEDSLVQVWNRWDGTPRAPLSGPEYLDYAEQNRTVKLAAFATGGVNLSRPGDPQRVPAAYVTPNLPDVLGMRPMLGHSFDKGHGLPGAPRAVVLTHQTWQGRFGADPSVVGQTVVVDGEPHEVIAVAPAGFRLPSDFGSELQAAVLLPLRLDPAAPRDRRGGHYLRAVGRKDRRAPIDSVRADLSRVVSHLIRQYPDEHDQGNFGTVVVPLRAGLLGEARPVLLILVAAVGVVLLVACANVASLLLARGEARRLELAIRTALGGSRYRLVRLMVTESCVLFVVGAAAGLAVARTVTHTMLAIDPTTLPRVDEVGLNLPVLLFALATALAGGVLFGALPALQVARVDVAGSLAVIGRGGVSRQRTTIGRSLVVAQVALAVVLLVGAGLLVKSLVRVRQVPSGFAADGVLTMRVSIPEAAYPGSAQVTAFFARLLDRVRALPGVYAAGAASGLPLAVASGDWSFDVEGRPPVGSRHHGAADWFAVTPGYFEALGVRLVRGRLPTNADGAGGEPTIVINETTARAVFADGRDVGQRLRLTGLGQPWRRITGVVADVRHRGLDSPPRTEMFIPHAQFLHFSPGAQARSMTLVIKAEVDPASLVAPALRALREIDAEVPAAQVRTMDAVVAVSIADRRLHVALMTSFAALALALAAVGLYGVLAHRVAQRRREIGVRIALGASATAVVRSIVGDGMRLVLVGAAIGAGGAWIVSRVLERLLFEVSPTDSAVFAATIGLLVAVAFVASYLPARRASRVDAAVALRAQ